MSLRRAGKVAGGVPFEFGGAVGSIGVIAIGAVPLGVAIARVVSGAVVCCARLGAIATAVTVKAADGSVPDGEGVVPRTANKRMSKMAINVIAPKPANIQ